MIVPEGWVSRRADTLFGLVSDKNHPEEELLSATQEDGVIPRAMLPARVTMPTGNLETFKLVCPNDFVISLRSFQGGIEHSKYRGLVSPAYTVLRSCTELDVNYYRHYFKSHVMLNDLKSSVIGIRDGKQISFGVFASIRLPYPPLPEQKKIAAILTSVDEAIQATRETIEQTKRVKQGLMQELLTRGIGHTRFRTLENGRTVPESWSLVPLGKVALVNRGLTWSRDQESEQPCGDSVPVIRIPNIQHQLDLTNVLHIRNVSEKDRSKRLARQGWSIMVGSNGNPDRVGNCVYMSEETDFLFASFLLGIEPIDHNILDGEFLYRLLSGNRIQSSISNSVQGSTGLRNISVKLLRTEPISLPPLPEQKKIATILTSVDDRIKAEEDKIQELQQVKRGLMQDLLTGRVRVAV